MRTYLRLLPNSRCRVDPWWIDGFNFLIESVLDLISPLTLIVLIFVTYL